MKIEGTWMDELQFKEVELNDDDNEEIMKYWDHNVMQMKIEVRMAGKNVENFLILGCKNSGDFISWRRWRLWWWGMERQQNMFIEWRAHTLN